MRIVAGVCLAALALAACNKSAEKTEAAAADGGTIATAAAPVPAGIDAAPHLRAGLWEISIGGAPGKARSCVDDASQRESAILGQDLDRGACARSDWSRIPGGVAFNFDCDNDGARVTSKGTVTGDFNSAYRMEADAGITRDGVTTTARQVVEARHVGACPPDMKPGDTQVTINGRTISVPRAPAG